MKSEERSVFDVASQVLLRDLRPFNPDDYEEISGLPTAEEQKREQRPGPCRCGDCVRQRKDARCAS